MDYPIFLYLYRIQGQGLFVFSGVNQETEKGHINSFAYLYAKKYAHPGCKYYKGVKPFSRDNRHWIQSINRRKHSSKNASKKY